MSASDGMMFSMAVAHMQTNALPLNMTTLRETDKVIRSRDVSSRSMAELNPFFTQDPTKHPLTHQNDTTQVSVPTNSAKYFPRQVLDNGKSTALVVVHLQKSGLSRSFLAVRLNDIFFNAKTKGRVYIRGLWFISCLTFTAQYRLSIP